MYCLGKLFSNRDLWESINVMAELDMLSGDCLLPWKICPHRDFQIAQIIFMDRYTWSLCKSFAVCPSNLSVLIGTGEANHVNLAWWQWKSMWCSVSSPSPQRVHLWSIACILVWSVWPTGTAPCIIFHINIPDSWTYPFCLPDYLPNFARTILVIHCTIGVSVSQTMASLNTQIELKII